MLNKSTSSSLATTTQPRRRGRPPNAERWSPHALKPTRGGDYRQLRIYELIAPAKMPASVVSQLEHWPPAPTARVSNGGIDVPAAVSAQIKLSSFEKAMSRPVAQRPKKYVEAVPIWVWSIHLRCWLHCAVSPQLAKLIEQLQMFGGSDSLSRAGYAHTVRVAELRQLGVVISAMRIDADCGLWVYDLHSKVTTTKPDDGASVLLIGDVGWPMRHRFHQFKQLQIEERAARQKDRLVHRLRTNSSTPPWAAANNNTLGGA